MKHNSVVDAEIDADQLFSQGAQDERNENPKSQTSVHKKKPIVALSRRR